MKKVSIKVSESAKMPEVLNKITKGLMKQAAISYESKTLIGNGGEQVNVIDNEIQINIIREVKEHDKTFICHCGTAYTKQAAVSYYTNYGGKIKRKHCCSTNCYEDVENMCGTGRVAMTKAKLSQIRAW